MNEVFVGSAALARGGLTRASLRWNFRALFPDIYLSKREAPTLYRRTTGAWLWSGRRGVITGRAAAALHGARWIDDTTPIEMLWKCGRPPDGIVVRNERIDALAGATGVKADDVMLLEQRQTRARGLRRARIAVPLMDGGAQSPQETRLRLILIDDGLPAPRTQIEVREGENVAFLDMGYDEPMVGFDWVRITARSATSMSTTSGGPSSSTVKAGSTSAWSPNTAGGSSCTAPMRRSPVAAGRRQRLHAGL